jgi:hypothetical protein
LTLDLSHKTLLGIASTALSVGIAVILVSFYKAGILGLIWGLMIGRSILSLIYPVIIGRFLKVPFYSQLKGAIRPLLVTVLLFILAASLDNLLLV